MLGCKYYSSHRGFGRIYGINRYMLGCKCIPDVLGIDIANELIDTCWDVNISAQLQNFVRQMELIDTCWDVNSLQE